jgi:hypothetical protein
MMHPHVSVVLTHIRRTAELHAAHDDAARQAALVLTRDGQAIPATDAAKVKDAKR